MIIDEKDDTLNVLAEVIAWAIIGQSYADKGHTMIDLNKARERLVSFIVYSEKPKIKPDPLAGTPDGLVS